jgi:spermidine synthase
MLFPAKMKILDRRIGLSHDLFVTRKGGTTILWSEAGTRHTVFDKKAPHLPGLEYARNTLVALAFSPRARSCLVLGLGGGSIPRMLLEAFPHLEVAAIEIDPAVVDLACRYFDVSALPRFTVHLEDAAVFLRRCNSQYALIVVDTYVGDRFPDQCASLEFLRDAGRCLTEDGVLVVNWLNDDSQRKKELLANIESVVGPVWRLPGLSTRNVLFFASTRAATRPDLVAAAEQVENAIPFKCSLKQLAQRLRRS